MRRSAGLVAAVMVFLTGCASAGDAGPATNKREQAQSPAVIEPSSTGSVVTATGSVGSDDPALPEPDAWIPRRAGALALELEATRAARRRAVAEWTRSGDPATWPPPDDVELLVLHEQLIYRLLATHDLLAERVLNRLGRGIVREARANVMAGGALYDHFSAVKTLPDFRLRAPEPANELLGHFRYAQERFGVDWEVLAAVMLIETRMGRIVSNSSAGAQGPMQFIPSTWSAYGLGGDIHDERDAVLGAANYLSASGAPNDYRQALYHYNPVPAYVTAVTEYAKAMRRDQSLFYTYYNWQVFVRTTRGDVRLTGPGL